MAREVDKLRLARYGLGRRAVEVVDRWQRPAFTLDARGVLGRYAVVDSSWESLGRSAWTEERVSGRPGWRAAAHSRLRGGCRRMVYPDEARALGAGRGGGRSRGDACAAG